MASRYTDQTQMVPSEADGGASSNCGALEVNASATSPLLHASGRSPLATLTGIQILSTGAYVPATVVRNEDLAELGYDKEWILQRTGIRERRRAAPDEATSDLAYEAAVRCLRNADVPASEVDMILVATMTPDTATPSAACNVQARLGANAPAMDINAACSGFMYALVTGMQFIKTGCCRRVLVIGGDIMSRIIDPEDKKTFPLFGDGAGAVLIGPSEGDQGFLSYSLGSEGDFGELLSLPGGGSREPLTTDGLLKGRQYVRMDGRAVFKWAVRLINEVVSDVVRFAEMTIEELDLVVLHQANVRIIDSAIQGLGIDPDKVFVNLDRYGNTTAASIPLALDEALAAGKLRRGDHILLNGFGAGLTWGAGVFRY
jgi:3-oxoacyl-[acyl-carrier-protein] synthase-3